MLGPYHQLAKVILICISQFSFEGLVDISSHNSDYQNLPDLKLFNGLRDTHIPIPDMGLRGSVVLYFSGWIYHGI